MENQNPTNKREIGEPEYFVPSPDFIAQEEADWRREYRAFAIPRPDEHAPEDDDQIMGDWWDWRQ